MVQKRVKTIEGVLAAATGEIEVTPVEFCASGVIRVETDGTLSFPLSTSPVYMPDVIHQQNDKEEAEEKDDAKVHTNMAVAVQAFLKLRKPHPKTKNALAKTSQERHSKQLG